MTDRPNPDAPDLAIIGAGATGLALATVAAQLGLAVALIERARPGGHHLAATLPRRALLAAAQTATTPPDWPAIWNRVHAAAAARAPLAARLAAIGAEIIPGEARFLDPVRLAIRAAAAERVLRPRHIVLATGRRPDLPSIPGLNGSGAFLEPAYVAARPSPDTLLILGDGAAALELAAAHAALGVGVTLVAPGRIAPDEDPELALGLALALRRAGVTLLEHATVARAEPATLHLADGTRLAATHLLVAPAAGTPDLAALDLPAGNVRTAGGAIAADRNQRSVSNRRVHVATTPEQAIRILRRALLHLPAGLPPPAPRVLYTAPQLAQVGMTEHEARAAGHQVRLLRWPLADTDRAAVERCPHGLVKLVLSRRGRLLGAGLLAPDAAETVGLLALALGRRLAAADLAALPLPPGTHAEAIRRAAAMHAAALAAAPWARRLVRLLVRLP